MASLIDRITRLAGSPQGQRLAQRAQELARDPTPAARSTSCGPA
jgi:hypothetical protein